MGFEWGKDIKNFNYVSSAPEGDVADTIMQKYPEIGVLITEHDYYNIVPFLRNGVLVVQPRCWGASPWKT